MINGIHRVDGYTHSKTLSEQPHPKSSFSISSAQEPPAAFNQAGGDSALFWQKQAFEDMLAKVQLELRSLTENQSEKQPEVDAREAFLAWMSMSDTEKMRANILSQLGLTEEELEDLSPEEREKIESIIEQRMEELVERSSKEQMEKNV